MKRLLQAILIFVLVNLYAWAAERVPIAILPLENRSGDTNSDCWQYAGPLLLKSQLKHVNSLRILPDSSIEFAFRELKLKPCQALQPDQVRQLGEIIEAQRVIWGSYQRENEKWVVAVQVMSVTTGEASNSLSGSSSDWFQVATEVGEDLLHEWGVTLGLEEKQRMTRPLTSSGEALELLGRGYTDLSERKSPSEAIISFRRAVFLDPDFAMAQHGLAECLLLQGKLDEAEEAAKRAIKARPDYSGAYSSLGSVYLFENSDVLAEHEFLEAIQHDPDDPYSYFKLSEIYGKQDKWNEAISVLSKAEELAPYEALIHAGLGRTYPYLGKPDEAAAEFKTAEHYDTGTEPGVEQLLAEGHDLLNDAPQAVEYYARFLAAVKKTGVESPVINQAEERLRDLKARFAPHFIMASAPQTFTPKELEDAIKTKLTTKEYRLVTNPLSSTSEMEKWAQQSVGDATNEMEEAKRLFQALTHHVDIGNEAGRRTAIEAFKDLTNPKAELSCQDYTFLYVALARHLKLKAYYVLVDKDYRGEVVSHACAGVFIGDKALLVDPAYLWFGVPHKQYEFENDLRAVAGYLAQSPDIPKARVSLKLAPDWPRPHFYVAMELASIERLTEARRALDAGLKHDSTSWLALCAKGTIELAEKDWKGAATDLENGLILNPDYDVAHYQIGVALFHEGKLEAAREQYRTYLGSATDPIAMARVRGYIEKIDETLKK